jgi:hypothetical protein
MAIPFGLGNRRNPNRREPGPQEVVKRSPLGSIFFGILILAVSAATLLAGFQANGKHLLPASLREFKLLDVNSALTLLVALLTLVAVRQQYLATLKPYLTYASQRVSKGEQGREDDGWKVEMWNVGTGVAIIQQTVYRLVTESGESCGLDHDAAKNELSKLGWAEGSTYQLPRFSTGFVLGPEHRISVFEIGHDALRQIRALDLEVIFASRSGEQYRKDIFLIPRPAPTETVLAPAGAASPPKASGSEGATADQVEHRA